jgi:hypothetical protein
MSTIRIPLLQSLKSVHLLEIDGINLQLIRRKIQPIFDTVNANDL